MRNFLKRYLVLISFIVIAVLLLWVTSKQWLPSFKNIFAAQPVVIDNTPILIKEINELAQLCTITAHDEVVVDSVDNKFLKTYGDAVAGIANAFQMRGTEKKLVVIGKGKIIAGVDLKKLTPDRIRTNQDSVQVQLPAAEILDAIMNPSDFEIFVESGIWSDEAVKAVKIKARNLMINRALQQQILSKAAARSKALLENFLRSAGFKYVQVTIASA